MEHISGDDNSDDGLQIVIESPRPKKRTKKVLDESDKKIIESVEKDIEEDLEEKAAKTNLTAKHVKNIIKEVVTNEHVLALVRHAENPEGNDDLLPVYEPKYTRAKTKELLSTSTPQKIVPWMSPPKSVSEVQMLFTEDLQDDSSGDEYVPENNSINSTVDTSLDISHTTAKYDEEANIALRTRSKLSLSHTPLEVIEEAFMPPDITTDMYDMDCDDDVWKEFLKTFTRPLDEVTKGAEDEDHDPEYNVLADEEIDKVDKEELRADRAVTVSRKEFNCLMAELFEFADIYESNKLNEKNAENNNESSEKEPNENTDCENDPNISIKKCQIPILAQQMRQHVQMLTQNFLLSYEHPEFSDMADKFKEMLSEIYRESQDKDHSIYHALNLQPAVKVVDDWEQLFLSGSSEVIAHKRFVEKVICESIDAKHAGTDYVTTFSPLLMEIVANNDTFLYPNLLPRIPFRSLNITRSTYHYLTHGEESLIALFLEQSIPYLKQDPFYFTQKKKINMELVCQLLSTILMPNVPPRKLIRHIRNKKSPDSEENPIKFFYRNKRAPPTVHYVVPMDSKDVLPPNKRPYGVLPLLWRQHIYPDQMNERSAQDKCNNNSKSSNQIILVSGPTSLRSVTNVNVSAPYNIKFSKRITNRKLLPKGPLLPYPNVLRKKRSVRKSTVSKVRQPSIIVPYLKARINKNLSKMLPDMPSLGNTPVKNNNPKVNTTNVKENNTDTNVNDEENISFKNVASLDFEFHKPKAVEQVKRNFESISAFSSSANNQNDSSMSTTATEKDNPADIHDLMVASSTVKSVTKKEPSGAEKKRAKLRREFVANLAMATPDDLETQIQKDESFADAFFDKLHQTLSMEDYEKLIHILGHYDESSGDFVELFTNVQSILFPKYQELAEEFYLFLTDIQAQKVGQLMPYFMTKDKDRFIKKLHIYFKDQPTQLKKIIKCMTDLSESPHVTMETIKTTVLPLFKGNAALTDWFLQIFPCERPPNLLTSGPHEVIDISKELARQPGEDICETVVLPDTEDPYGGSSCICTCHNVENLQFKSRSQHCKNCGIKFIQGKIYIQTGKALRPAVVSFITNPEKDHSTRLTATQRKRSDTSPNKQNSPNKESQAHEEVRNSNESDDDDGKKKNQKQTKSQNKRKVKDRDKQKPKLVGKANSRESCKTPKVKADTSKVPKSLKRQNKKKPAPKKTELKPGSTLGQHKRPAEESEIEYTEPPELVTLKVSSDHSGESGSVPECFESSQDITNTEGDDSSDSLSINSSHPSGSSKDVTWTREEDKIILQAFRQGSNNDETFKRISELLQNRSVLDVKNRFHKLMSLLQEMASK